MDYARVHKFSPKYILVDSAEVRQECARVRSGPTVDSSPPVLVPNSQTNTTNLDGHIVKMRTAFASSENCKLFIQYLSAREIEDCVEDGPEHCNTD